MDFPLTLDKKYLKYIDYLLQKQELANRTPSEVTALDGLKLMASFLFSIRSIQKGYKDYSSLQAKLDDCASRGESIVITIDSVNFTLSLRSRSG